MRQIEDQKEKELFKMLKFKKIPAKVGSLRDGGALHARYIKSN